MNKYKDVKIYVLQVSKEEEKKRHIARNDTQTEVWLKGRRTQINNIMTNMFIMNQIESRYNNSITDSEKLKQEIIKYIK